MDEFYHAPGNRKYWLTGGLAAVIIILILAGLFFFRANFLKNAANNLSSPISSITSTAPGSLESRISTLEDAVAVLIKRVNNISGSGSVDQPVATTSDNSEIASLQATVASLQTQINVLKSSSTTTSNSSSNAAGTVAYIPLGWTGSTSATTYTQISGQSITINTANYPGYTSMQFQVNLQVYQGNGAAYAQLFDVTDGIAIIPSTVSTTSGDYTWVTSGTFQLPAGSKTYTMQLYTNTTYSANVQNARIQVNF